MKTIKRVNRKSFHHKGRKPFALKNFYLYEMTGANLTLWKPFQIC